MMYIRGDAIIILGKFPHAGVALGYIPKLELSIKTPISMIQNMHGVHPANKAQKECQRKTHAHRQQEYSRNIQ